jgi:hypothetical protein
VRFPAALSLRAERLQASVSVLTDSLGCDIEEVRAVLRKHPQILGYRPQAVLEKLRAIAEVYGLGEDARGLKAGVVKYPAVLSYSLEGRLRPRLSAAKEGDVPVEMAFSWMALQPARFEERVAKEAEVIRARRVLSEGQRAAVVTMGARAYEEEKMRVLDEMLGWGE